MSNPRADTTGSARRGDIGVLVAVGGCIVAGIAVLVATWHGPGLNPDSANYISSGLALARGDGLVPLGGGHLTLFPPGLPSVVAFGDLIGLTPATTIRILNVAAFLTTIWCTRTLLRRHLLDQRLAWLGTAFVAVGIPLLTVGEMAWTELTFIALCLVFVIALEQSLAATIRTSDTGSSSTALRWLGAAVVLTWAAFLFRYMGLALIPAGALAVLIGDRRPTEIRRRLLHAVAFGVAASTVPLTWMLRNRSVDGTLMGERHPSVDQPIGTLERFVATLGRWVLPDPTPVAVQALMGVALCGAAAWVVLAAWRRARRAGGDPTPAAGTALTPLVTFFAVFAVYLIAAQLTTAFDQLGTRLMSPLFVPMVVLGLVAVDRMLVTAPRHLRQPLRRAAFGVLTCLLLLQGVLFARHVLDSARSGVDYSSPTWRSSQLGADVRRLRPDVRVFSNAPAGLWTITARTPLVASPSAHAYRSDETVPIPDEFLRTVACHTTYLAWFDDIPGSFLLTPDQLRRHVRVEVIDSTDDGTLYRLGPLDPDAARCR